MFFFLQLGTHITFLLQFFFEKLFLTLYRNRLDCWMMFILWKSKRIRVFLWKVCNLWIRRNLMGKLGQYLYGTVVESLVEGLKKSSNQFKKKILLTYKGQLISEWLWDVFIWTKKRAKILLYFRHVSKSKNLGGHKVMQRVAAAGGASHNGISSMILFSNYVKGVITINMVYCPHNWVN